MITRTPIITVHQPYAELMFALDKKDKPFKTIETREHSRFDKLVGQRVGIHAAKREISNYRCLSIIKEIERYNKNAANHLYGCMALGIFDDVMVYGAIIGTVKIERYNMPIINLGDEFWRGVSRRACADIFLNSNTLKALYTLEEPRRFAQPIPATGRQGIWYYDLKKAR